MVFGVNSQAQVGPTAIPHCIRMSLAFLHWLINNNIFIPCQFTIQGETQELGRRLHLYYIIVNFSEAWKLDLPSENNTYRVSFHDTFLDRTLYTMAPPCANEIEAFLRDFP